MQVEPKSPGKLEISRFKALQEVKRDQRHYCPSQDWDKPRGEPIEEKKPLIRPFVPVQMDSVSSIEPENKYRCCTGTVTDRRLLLFIASFTISTLILFFSCYMLSLPDTDCSTEQTYISLVMLILGWWAPSPV